ncbi:MAG: hypothetical protein JWN02_1254 [Acidobacteria bacterium]|nr:hypothetical protein [Acidobacteriota bacterium]
MIKQKSEGLGRREFLMYTSGTALAVMTLGPELLSAASVGTSSAPTTFSLGYSEPDALERTGDKFPPNVMAAERVTSSDGRFIDGGVRVAVRGWNFRPEAASSLDALDLVVEYRVPGNDGSLQSIPFNAWSYTKKGRLISSPLSFTVSLDHDQHLRMLLSTNGTAGTAPKPAVEPLAPGRSRRSVFSGAVTTESIESGKKPEAVTLTLLSEDMPKIRRGYYILAPVGNGVSAPDWSRLQLRRDEGGLKLYQANGIDADPARFEYLILLLDYVSEPETAAAKAKRRK